MALFPQPAKLPTRATEVSNERISLPIYAAYCVVAGALRSFNWKGSRFVAVLVLEPDVDPEPFTLASKIFLQAVSTRESYYDRSDSARTISKSADVESVSKLISRAEAPRQAVYVTNQASILTPWLHLAVDIVATLPKPKVEHFQAGAIQLFRSRPKQDDLQYLAAQGLGRLQGAFRNGRPLKEALRRMRQDDRGEYQPPPEVSAPEDKGPTLDDLDGFGELADWGRRLATDISDWRQGKIPWTDVDRGVLISGPPGTGKTMFAGALARTCGVPLIVASYGSWQEHGSMDDTLKAMAASFAVANENAPSILFVDEVDAIGSRFRTSDHNAYYMRAIISRFLELLDGSKRRTGVVVVGACNLPDLLDPAIKRPGRLERHMIVPLPNEAARTAIFEYHTGVKLLGSERSDFGQRSIGLTGADIELLAREARRDARTRGAAFRVSDALDKLPSVFEFTPEFARRVAVHEIGHAIVAVHSSSITLESVAIADRALRNSKLEAVGGAQIATYEALPKNRSHFLDRIATDLAGIAGEKEIFGSFNDGASGHESSDLGQATHYATLVEGVLGMGKSLISYPSRDRVEIRALLFGNPALQLAVNKLMDEQLRRAQQIIRQNRKAFDDLVEQLILAKHLTGAAVRKAVRKHGGVPTDREFP